MKSDIKGIKIKMKELEDRINFLEQERRDFMLIAFNIASAQVDKIKNKMKNGK